MYVVSQMCADLLAFDTSLAQSVPGFVRFLTAADIPGTNSVGDFPLFVPLGSSVTCVGAALGLVIATSETAANQAAAAVQVSYSSQTSLPIKDIDDAIAQQSFYNLPSIPTVSQLYIHIYVCISDTH